MVNVNTSAARLNPRKGLRSTHKGETRPALASATRDLKRLGTTGSSRGNQQGQLKLSYRTMTSRVTSGFRTARKQMVDKSPTSSNMKYVTVSKAQEPTTKDLVEGCVIVIRTIFEMFGMRKGMDISGTVSHWMRLVDSVAGDWVKIAKYKTSAFFSWWAMANFPEDRIMPPTPWESKDMEDHPEILLGGRGYRFVSRLRHSSQNSLTWWAFIDSVLKSKKGMPRPTAKYLEKALKDTEELLTTPPPPGKDAKLLNIPWGELTTTDAKLEWNLSQSSTETQLRRTVRELCTPEGELTIHEKIQGTWPSSKANFTHRGEEGGTIASVLESDIMQGLRVPGGYLDRSETTTDSYNTDALEGNLSTLWLRALEKAASEPKDAKLVALEEPLKVRVIAKGPPFTYLVLRCVWKKLHNILRNHPTFKVIGTPVTEEIILNSLGSELKEDEMFLSGDYANATNKLKSWVSIIIADEVSKVFKLGKLHANLFKEALVNHIINGKPQENGQSMGSIVSFPVLCIANAALTRWAIELSTRNVTLLRDSRMLINGDDIAAKGKMGLYKFWKQITAFAGLEESLGKTYWSREFVQINSLNFLYTKKYKLDPRGSPYPPILEPSRVIHYYDANGRYIHRNCPYVRVDFVNMGLLLGLKRSSAERSEDNDEELTYGNMGARARELVRMAPSFLKNEVMSEFFELNRQNLLTAGVPWFIPESLGGLGLPSFTKRAEDGTLVHFGADELTRRKAAWMLQNIGKKVFPEMQQSRLTWSPKSLGSKALWATRALAAKRVPKPEYFEYETLEAVQYEQRLHWETLNLLFDKRISLESLLLDLKKETPLERLRHNRRLWASFRGSDLAKVRPAGRSMYEAKLFEGLKSQNTSRGATQVQRIDYRPAVYRQLRDKVSLKVVTPPTREFPKEFWKQEVTRERDEARIELATRENIKNSRMLITGPKVELPPIYIGGAKTTSQSIVRTAASVKSLGAISGFKYSTRKGAVKDKGVGGLIDQAFSD